MSAGLELVAPRVSGLEGTERKFVVKRKKTTHRSLRKMMSIYLGSG